MTKGSSNWRYFAPIFCVGGFIVFFFIFLPAGAAQAATNIYYSVGQNTSDHKTGTPTITISDGVATFSEAQTASNMGVGDKISYGDAGATTTVYISAKQSQTVWNVETKTGGQPTATTSATVLKISHVFNSLEAAITGASGVSYLNTSNLVTGNYILNIPCYYDSAADTNAVTISGYMTGADNYIKIYTPDDTSTEANSSQRHEGKWDMGKYRLVAPESVGHVIYSAVKSLWIDGLQIELTGTGGGDNGAMWAENNQSDGGVIKISNNIVRQTNTNRSGLFGIVPFDYDYAYKTTYEVWNNIVYGFATKCIGISYGGSSSDTDYIYNNTVYGCGTGVLYNGGGKVIVKNNIAYNNTIDYSGSFNSSSTNNLSEDGTAPPFNTYYTGKTLTFVNTGAGTENFHLVSADTDAIDKGADLHADTNLAFDTDIDGQARTGTWDIGADEFVNATTSIYYSVGQNTNDHKTGSPTVTISGGVATFSVAQTATNMGVGDKISFGDAGATTTVYISAKQSQTVWDVVTATGSEPEATTSVEVLKISHAFSSLEDAVTGASGAKYLNTSDLVAGNYILNIPCYYDSGPDTSAVTVSDWNTSASDYLRIYTPFDTASEVNLSQRHSGVWSTNKYRLEITSGGGEVEGIDVLGPFAKIDGLQVKVVSPANGNEVDGIGDDYSGVTNSKLWVSNNIVWGVLNYNSNSDGIQRHDAAGTDNNFDLYAWNNIVYGFLNYAGNAYAGGIYCDVGSCYVYNNTVYDSNMGFIDENGKYIAKNNLAYNNFVNYGRGGGEEGIYFLASSTNNLSGPTLTDAPGSNPQNDAAITFTDAANDDFHLVAGDTAAIGQGADLSADPSLSFSTDIDGQSRGTTWDIGADQLVTSSPAQIYRSVGPGNTAALAQGGSDNLLTLSAGTITFTSPLPDRIGVGDALEIDTNGNDAIDSGDTILFIDGRISSTQYSVETAAGLATTTSVIDSQHWIIRRAYTSLADAVGNFNDYWADNPNLTPDSAIMVPFDYQAGLKNIAASNKIWNVACYGDAPDDNDGSGVETHGWITDKYNYLRIYTPYLPSEVGVSQRHQGKWDESKYNIIDSNSDSPENESTNIIDVFTNYVRVQGLQIESPQTSDNGDSGGINIDYDDDNAPAGGVIISDDIIKSGSPASAHSAGIAVAQDGTSIYNNLIYGFSGDQSDGVWDMGLTSVYNNTISDSYCGINSGWEMADAKNDLVMGNRIDYTGVFTGDSDHDAWASSSPSFYEYGDGAHNANGLDLSDVASTTVFKDPAIADYRLKSGSPAIGQGANLSADPNLSFNNDIAGTVRPPGAAWDIGADEYVQATATPIYRSVGPGSTGALVSGSAENTLSISGDTATFSEPLPDKVGVGDTIEFDANSNGSIDSGDEIVFIQGRISSTEYTIKDHLGQTPVGVSDQSKWEIYRAYTSLNDAVNGNPNPSLVVSSDNFAGSGRDLVANNEYWNIACYGDATDTTAVNFAAGWVTGPKNYLRIYTPYLSSEVGASQRHGAVWDPAKYHISPSADSLTIEAGDSGFDVDTDYLIIDGLQIEGTTYPIPDWNYAVLFRPGAGDQSFTDNIIKGHNISESRGIALDNVAPGYKAQIANNIIYDFDEGIAVGQENGAYVTNVFIYNNTIVNNGNSLDAWQDTGQKINLTAKNNILFNNPDWYDASLATSTENNAVDSERHGDDFAAGLVDLTTACGGSACTAGDIFTDPADDDFRLKADSPVIDQGADLANDSEFSFNYDLAGITRPQGAAWDIGADEYVPITLNVYYSVGQNTDDHKTGSPTITISDGVATFSAAQTATNMGVGDKISYGDASATTTVYISAKQSNTVWNVITATGGEPEATTTAEVLKISHVFSSLANAVTGASGANYLNTTDLVGGDYVLNIPCYYDSGPDQTAVTISGWTTGEDNYLKIYTPNSTSTEVNVSQRHRGKWDNGKYNIVPPITETAENTILVEDSYTRIEGLQLKTPTYVFNYNRGIYVYNSDQSVVDVRISGNLITEGSGNTSGGRGINYSSTGSQHGYVFDNIIYGFDADQGIGLYLNSTSGTSSDVYANTITDCNQGINQGSTSNLFKNNLLYGNVTDYIGSFAAASSHNAYTVGSDPGGSDNLDLAGYAAVDVFADPSDDDFLLTKDSPAIDQGTDLSADLDLAFSVDVKNQTRTGAWDIGADEFSSSSVIVSAGKISRIASTVAGGGSDDSVTTLPINTTGATLLVVGLHVNQSTSTLSITDSLDNIWHPLKAYGNSNAGGFAQIWYAYNATTSAAQTFSVNAASNNWPALTVSAWSGTATGSDVFDAENGNTTTTSNTINTGSVTPAVNGELLISLLTNPYDDDANPQISDSFAISKEINNGNSMVGVMAYLVASTTDSIDPNWTVAGGMVQNSVAIAAFKPAENENETPATTTPAQIYRSVGPDNTDALASGDGSFTLTIDHGAATFSGGTLPDNAGVGDAIVYDSNDNGSLDSGDSIVFIMRRYSDSSYEVQTEDGATSTMVNVSNKQHWAVYRAYTSLGNAVDWNLIPNPSIPVSFDVSWSNLSDRDLVTPNWDWNIACYGDAVDSNVARVEGWVTNANDYVRIYTPYLPTEVGVSQRHAGKWDDSKYHLSPANVYPTNSNDIIYVGQNFTRIEGLQIRSTTAGTQWIDDIELRTDGNDGLAVQGIYVDDNILKEGGADSNSRLIEVALRSQTDYYDYIFNNLLYDSVNRLDIPGISIHGGDNDPVSSSTKIAIYNNTIVGMGDGIDDYLPGVTDYRLELKNNLIYDSSSWDFADDVVDGGTENNNAYTSWDHGYPGASDLDISGYASTSIFADPADQDFRLKPGSPVIGMGANLTDDSVLPLDSDFVSQARPASGVWDIGAQEFDYQIIPGATTATIIWQTADAESSQVDYGESTGYGLSSSSAAIVTLHTINLKGLSANTIYHFQIDSSIYGDQTFQTLDVSPPVITSFSIATSSSRLNVSITSLTATDDAGINGYLVSESSSTPVSDNPDWSATVPFTHNFLTGGHKNLYAWAKDFSGNISDRASTFVDITLTAPTQIYRSVGPGRTTALASSTESFTLTINNGAATFSGGSLPDNSGVGDAIVYDSNDNGSLDSGDSIVFIDHRNSDSSYGVQTEHGSSSTINITNASHWAVYRAYTSLWNAVGWYTAINTSIPVPFDNFPTDTDPNENNRDLVTPNSVWNVACYADAPDDKAEVDGWTVSARNYVNIFTPYLPSQVGVSQRANGKWDDSKYRIEPVSNTESLIIWRDYTRVEGLQIDDIGYDYDYGIGLQTDYDGYAQGVYLSDNIIKDSGPAQNTAHEEISAPVRSQADYYDYIFNNIIIAPAHSVNNYGILITAYGPGSKLAIDNNTVVNAFDGIVNDNGGTTDYLLKLKNNLVYGGTDSDYGVTIMGDDESTNNAYSIGADPGTNSVDLSSYASTTIFADPADDDYRLKAGSPVIGQGANLSADPDLAFDNDITGTVRPQGTAWDIGASEYQNTAINVYYSVGQNTDDHKTGSPTLNITDGIGTFSVAQTAVNMGVGDEVTYDTDQAAYISGKISTSQWTLVTATGGMPADVANATVNSIAHVFSSLENAVTGASDANHLDTNDLVAGNYILNIPCYYDSGPDTAAVYITGWTTGLSNYINIYTPDDIANQSNRSQRNNGKWDDEKFALTVTDDAVIDDAADFLKIDGLQLKTIDSNAYEASGFTTDGVDGGAHIWLSDNIIAGVVSGKSYGGSGISMNYYNNAGDPIRYFDVWNNIIYGFDNKDDGTGIAGNSGDATVVSRIYNNTVSDCGVGILNGSDTLEKNNISYGNRYDYYGNSINASSTNNAYANGNAPAVDALDLSSYPATAIFTDPLNNDFRLAAGSPVKGQGADLSADPELAFTDDITGAIRPAGEWDIGAVDYSFQVIRGNNSATIIWSTDEATSSLINYGTAESYGLSSSSAAVVTAHSITIKGLAPKTVYHFEMSGTTYGDQTFTSLDIVAPTITAFSIPAATYLLTVPLTFSASDDTGVTGYFVSESSSTPQLNDKKWSSTVPVSYAFSSFGFHKLYAWVRDADGNLSAPASSTVTITFSAPKPVYYSVGQNTDDHKTGNPTLTIASGVGTFSVAQTAADMGVGDKVTYDADQVAYISGKISTSQWTLTTATGATPADISGATVNSITHAFASLEDMVGGAADTDHLDTSDLVAGNYILNIPCYYDSGPDTSAVTIDGWNTGPSNYLKIYTPDNVATEVNLSQRHQGKWDDSKYNLQISGTDVSAISVQSVGYVKIEGLQIKSTFLGQYGCGLDRGNSVAGAAWFSDNIIWGVLTQDGYIEGIGAHDQDDNSTVYAWNNIIYGFGYAPYNSYQGGIYCDSGNCYAYNNTVYQSNGGVIAYGGNFAAKNNISYDNVTNYVGEDFTASSTDNLSGPTQSGAFGSDPQNDARITFVNANNGDFHLVASDTAAIGQGTNLSADSEIAFSTDIDGQTRGTSWDVGADQYVQATATPIYRSVGPGSTGALVSGSLANTLTISGSVATFSSALPDKIGVGDAIEFDANSNGIIDSGDEIVFIQGRISTTEYVVKDHLGQTPVGTSGQSKWEIYRSYVSLNDAVNGILNPSLVVPSDNFADSGRDLVANNEYWNIACYGDATDTAAVNFAAGWVTGPENYLRIYAPYLSSEVGVSQRHGAIWDPAKYHVSPNTNDSTISGSGVDYLIIDGLQIEGTSDLQSSGQNALGVSGAAGNHYILDNILKGHAIAQSFGIVSGSLAEGHRAYVINNLIYDFGAGLRIRGGEDVSTTDAFIYNDTFANNTYTYYNYAAEGSVINFTAKNNIFFGNPGELDASVSGSTNNAGNFNYYGEDFSTNLLDLNTACGGSACAAGDIFANPADDDYRLKAGSPVIGMGANLTSDPDYAFNSDLAGNSRPATGAWDIGADEYVATTTNVYYSVGQNTDDHKTGSPTLTISDGVGTFSVAQTATNMGVGDEVTYDTNNVAYIAGKISTTQWTLVTALGATPADISGASVDSIAHAFASLENAVSGSSGANYLDTSDLVAGNYILNIPCYYDSGPDTSAVTIDGWNTGSSNYINIYAPNNTTSQVNQTQRHSGKWDETKYALIDNNTQNELITVNSKFVRLDGLQTEIIRSGNAWATTYEIYPNDINSDIRVSDNISRANFTGLINGGTALSNSSWDSPANIKVWNSLFYDYSSANHNSYGFGLSDGNIYSYSNTLVNCDQSIFAEATGTIEAENNIVQNAISSGYSGNISGDYNISNLNDAPGAHSKDSATVSFISIANNDYHLSADDTTAIGAGINLSSDPYLPFSDDIDGQARGSVWDIGADQFVAPIILAIGTSTAGATATITWITDEAATSTVEYGLTDAYGNASSSDAFVTEHSITLRGLDVPATYHYRIKTTDADGSETVSADHTFTTFSTSIRLLASTGVIDSGDEGEGVTTPAINTTGASLIVVGLHVYNSTSTVSITDSMNNIWHHLKAYGTSAGGDNSGYNGYAQIWYAYHPTTSPEQTFSVNGASSNYPVLTVTAWSGIATDSDPYDTGNGSTTNSGNTISTGSVAPASAGELLISAFSSGDSNGTDFGIDSGFNISDSEHNWSDMDGAMAYYIAPDTDSYDPTWTVTGDVNNSAAIAVFRPADNNISSSSDITPPVITLTGTSTTADSATITWTTDEPATSSVSYGLDSGYGLASSSDSLETEHSITLRGLEADTIYHFQIGSTDAAGNRATSSDHTFTTAESGGGGPPSDNTPPTIDSFVVSSTSASLSVPIVLTASDDTGVTGYLVNEFSAIPSADDPEWRSTATTTYTFADAGSKTLYAWARDAAGNISASASAPVTVTLPTYTVGGSVSGLSGTVTLQNNGSDDLDLTSNGPYAFATALNDGAAYNVTVLNQPSGQLCSVDHYYGTIAGAAVSDINISCEDISAPLVIYQISSSTTAYTATISWLTNVAADSAVNYGPDENYGSVSSSTPSSTSNSVTLSGLTPNNIYHFQIIADDSSGDSATTTDFTFQTALSPYTLAYSAGANGSILGNSNQSVAPGADGAAVTAEPIAGYHFTLWSDSSTANPRKDLNVAGNISVSAGFAINTYTITASSSSYGTIAPSGITTKNYGESQGYTVTATTGYHVTGILVDSVLVSTSSTYIINNIQANHVVSAAYASDAGADTYVIGGRVSGLSGTVILQNNGGDNLIISANGVFNFATELDDAAGYNVTVLTNPGSQTCTISSGQGIVADADVNNILVSCATVHNSGNGSGSGGGGGGGGGGASAPVKPPDTTPPGLVSNLFATSSDGQITLSWTNPSDSDFAGVKIYHKLGSPLSGYTDPLASVIYLGNAQKFVDSGLSNGQTYYYSIYSYDNNLNYSTARTTAATAGSGQATVVTPVDILPPSVVVPASGSSSGGVVTSLIGASSAVVNQVTADEADTLLANAQYVALPAVELSVYQRVIALATAPLTAQEKITIAYFIHVGTPTTHILGAGERGGSVSSFQSAYGYLPVTLADWQDVLKIGNGRWPTKQSPGAIKTAQESFKTIYGRPANMNNTYDNNAVTIMAYGLRPAQRNQTNEKIAIKAYYYFFKHNPVTARAWDAVRAIAYSGAKR